MYLYDVKKILLVILLLVPFFSWAQNIYDLSKVACPSVEVIQQSSQKLDTAQKINDEYLVYTAESVFQTNNLWWYIGVGGISASSPEDAINQGKSIALNINNQKNTYATKQGNEFICKYGPGRVEARGKNLSYSNPINFLS